MEEHETQETLQDKTSVASDADSSSPSEFINSIRISSEHHADEITGSKTPGVASDATQQEEREPKSVSTAEITTEEAQTKPKENLPTQDDENSNNNSNDDDDFGDFGSAKASATTAIGGGEDDEFDDFSAAEPNAFSNNQGFDDDDGFGDFGEVQTTGAGDDDDFGDFNDFAAGGDDFQDSGDFGDFEAGDNVVNGEDPFGTQGSGEIQVPMAAPVEQVVVDIAPDFNAVNSRQVENYVLDHLASLYPLDNNGDESLLGSPTLLNSDMEDMDIASVLSEQKFWTSLCEQSFQGGSNGSHNNSVSSPAPQFQWKYSTLRKEYYASLGLVIAKEQAVMAPTSIPNSVLSPASSRSKVSSPMIVSTETMTERKPLDIEATHAYCQFTKENLGGYSGDEMKDIIARLTEMTRQASEELTYWLDQREQMIMDSERYNEMIASLVGRAAKLKDAESKQNTKTKRLTRTSFHLK